jgi:hypothetical protein
MGIYVLDSVMMAIKYTVPGTSLGVSVEVLRGWF